MHRRSVSLTMSSCDLTIFPDNSPDEIDTPIVAANSGAVLVQSAEFPTSLVAGTTREYLEPTSFFP